MNIDNSRAVVNEHDITPDAHSNKVMTVSASSAAGAIAKNTYSDQATAISAIYVKLRTVTINGYVSGSINIRFTLFSLSGAIVYGKIYKNGVAFGYDQNTTSTTGAIKSEDFNATLIPTDTIELWGKSDASNEVGVYNFMFYYDQVIPVTNS